MIHLADERDRALVVQAIEDPESAIFPPGVELLVDNVNVAPFLEAMTRESGDNGGMILDFTVATRLPENLPNAPVQTSIYLNGVKVPYFAGRLGKPKVVATSTQALGQSGAVYLEKAKLGSGVMTKEEIVSGLAFEGSASRLIRRAVEGSGLYAREHVKISKIDRRVKREADDQRFAPEQSARDLLSAVADEAKAVYRDAPHGRYGQFEAFRDPVLGELPSTVWSYEASKEEGFEHESDTDEMFFDVVVEKKADPTSDPPVPGFYARRPVPYRHLAFLPPASNTDWITVTDDDGVAAFSDARAMARDVAKKHARLYESFSISVALNPLLQMYDAILIGEDFYERGGRQRFEWLCVIDSHKDDFATMRTEISGRAHVVNRTFVPDPPIILTGRSPEVVPSIGTKRLTPSNDLYPSDELFPAADPEPVKPSETLVPGDYLWPS